MGSYIAQASEEEMAEVEAATKQLLDTRGGNLLKILIAAATSYFDVSSEIFHSSVQARLWRLCFLRQ